MIEITSRAARYLGESLTYATCTGRVQGERLAQCARYWRWLAMRRSHGDLYASATLSWLTRFPVGPGRVFPDCLPSSVWDAQTSQERTVCLRRPA